MYDSKILKIYNSEAYTVSLEYLKYTIQKHIIK